MTMDRQASCRWRLACAIRAKVCLQPATWPYLQSQCFGVRCLFCPFPSRLFHHRQKSRIGGATCGRSFLVFLLVDQTLPRFLSAKAFPPRFCPHCDHSEETGEDGKLSMCVGLTISHPKSASPFPKDAAATRSPERGGGGTRSSRIPAFHPTPPLLATVAFVLWKVLIID